MEFTDVFYDLKRLKRKCKRLANEWDDCTRLVQEKNIESEYQEILCFILDNAEIHEHQKRKRDDVIYIDDDEEDGCDGQKEDDKSFVVETVKNGERDPIIYEAINGLEDESRQYSWQNIMTCAENSVGLCSQNLNNRAVVVQHRSNMQARTGNEARPIKKNKVQTRVKSEGHLYHKAGRRNSTEKLCECVYLAQPVKEAKTQNQRKSKAVVKIKNEHSSSLIDERSNKLVRNHSKYAGRARCGHKNNVENPRKKIKVVKGTKVKEENEPDRINSIKILRNNPVKENVCGPADQAQPSQKKRRKNVVKECKRQIDRKLKGKNVVKGDRVITIDSEDSSDDSDPMNNLVIEGNDEVEILESAAIISRGLSGPFVPATRFDKSMMDDDVHDHGRPTVSDEFREEVLKVLRKPKDNDEYKSLRGAIRANRSYLGHYKSLRRELTENRYRKGKCLTLLRGFFFWLQNLTREGSFQPWKDRECLAVEPPSP